MLRFPLPPVPSDASLPIERLNPGIHQQLCSWLDREGRSWELLDFAMAKVSVQDKQLLICYQKPIKNEFLLQS